jgi:ribosomal protein S27AE
MPLERASVRPQKGPDFQTLLAQLRAGAQAKPLRSQRLKCPRCGGIVFLADRSRFDLARRIEHVWCCDDCCNEFVTSISLVQPLPV